MTTTRRQVKREARDSAARRPRPKVSRLWPAALPEGRAPMARLLHGLHHLADEALRSLGDLAAVTDAARARIEVIVRIVMAGSAFADPRDGPRGFEIVRVSGESASRAD